MKAGDLVRRKKVSLAFDRFMFGIIIWTNGDMKPMILWEGGHMEKEWTTNLEVVSESR